MDQFAHDLSFGLRLLWKNRGYSATVLATLAVCLAANAAMFAIVRAVLLRPLPFPEPERIVTMYNAYPAVGAARGSNAVPDYYDRLRETNVFQEIAVSRTTGVTIGGQDRGPVERITSMHVSPSFFRLLRAAPYRGRLFTPDEAEVGHDRKVVLSYGAWQRLFGGRDSAIGQTLRINAVLHDVVGVLPADFRFVDPDVQIWTVVAFTAEERSDARRHSNNWQMTARLRPGATVAQAQQQIDALNARNLERFPQFKQILINAGFHTVVVGLHEDLVSEAKSTLSLLWGGVVLVLIIGCVNVANLASVRATARTHELVTRLALGASNGRLARQVLTESILLCALGGVAGLALGRWALGAVSYLGLDHLPRGSEIGIDAGVVGYMLALVTAVALVVGLLSIVALRRANLAAIIREEGRSGTASRTARLVRRVLVTAQVAFALMLLVGGALMLASFRRVLAVETGFRADHVLTGKVGLPAARYNKDADLVSAYDRLLPALRTIPGVEAAGLSSTIPFGDDYSDSVILAEGHVMKPGESLISPSQLSISEGYLESMGVTLLRGRFFDARDASGAPLAVIVDRQLAEHFWPNQDPIGKRMYLPSGADDVLKVPPDDKFLHVVGVVGAVKLRSLTHAASSGAFGAYYLPLRQFPERTVFVTMRTPLSPEQLVSAIRSRVAAVDGEVPFYDVQPMTRRVDEALMDRRAAMVLAVGFALVASFLAAIGIYGVLAYQVAQRTREIGIRMALGAERASIFSLVLREGATMVGLGAALGLIGAVLLRQLLQSQLFGISATDPAVLAGVSVVLVVIALVACLVPARKAARTDAVVALTAL